MIPFTIITNVSLESYTDLKIYTEDLYHSQYCNKSVICEENQQGGWESDESFVLL